MKSEINQKWDKRFIDMAGLVGSWSSCIRENRQVGAVITKNHRIVSTGYNGAPAGVKNCKERGVCLRDQLHIKSGTMLEMCIGMCAEQNAIAQAAKMGVSVDGGTIYVTHAQFAPDWLSMQESKESFIKMSIQTTSLFNLSKKPELNLIISRVNIWKNFYPMF